MTTVLHIPRMPYREGDGNGIWECDHDEWGEIVNGEKTYDYIAKHLLDYNPVFIGWSDGEGTHFDVLFTTVREYTNPSSHQRGIRPSDLFVSVMSVGSYGFELDKDDTHPGYFEEKLFHTRGGKLGSTGQPLADLINGVRKAIYENSRAKSGRSRT